VGRKSSRKGYRGEKEWADLTGGQRLPRDHRHDVFAEGRFWEVKLRAAGFGPVYSALEEYERHARSDDGPPLVAFRQDRKRWVIAHYYGDPCPHVET